MKVNVNYDGFDAGIDSADIKIDDTNSFIISIATSEDEPIEKTLEFRIGDKDDSEDGVVLKMTLEQAKQFDVLLRKFFRQM